MRVRIVLQAVFLLLLGALNGTGVPWPEQAQAARRQGAGATSPETVFDNSGSAWPLLSVTPSIAYDVCGAGCAFVTTPSAPCNANGNPYRSDYVNFKVDASSPGGFRIGCFLAGDRYNTLVSFPSAGPFYLNLVASNGGGSSATIAISIDGAQMATLPVGLTGDYNTFQTFQSGSFTAGAGTHKLTISCLVGESSFNGCGDMRSWQGVPTAPDGLMSEAPYGGAMITQFGTFTWGGVHPIGAPTYYLNLNGTQVDAGDELEVANTGNVYLWQGGNWYGPWTTAGGFGPSPNASVHLQRITFVPQIASSLSDASTAGTVVTTIVGYNSDGTTAYGGSYTLSSLPDGLVMSGNNIVVGSGGLPAGTATYVHTATMNTPILLTAPAPYEQPKEEPKP